MKLKNSLVMFLFAAVIGAVIGGVVWGFLRVMHLGLWLLWEVIPAALTGAPAALWPLLLCAAGGIVIGFLQKKWGPYPEELSVVLARKKKEGSYPYDHIPRLLLAALLPLLFGASLGPEAGLTGVIVGLCCWAGDNLKYAGKVLPELADVGFAATLSVLFGSPLFGFVLPVEKDIYSDEAMILPKGVKIFATFCGIFGGLGIYMLLGHLFGGGSGLPRFGEATVNKQEILWMLPVALIGVAYGLLFKLGEKVLGEIAAPFRKYPIALALCGGVALGGLGMLFPLGMFSGEEEMAVLMQDYLQYTPLMLFLLAAVKMLLIQICLCSGWRGGHFFPAIFAGVCVGYGCALLLSIDPVFSCAVACAAVMTTIMRKPFAVAMLLMLCFPANCLIWMILVAFLGALLPEFTGKRAAKV